MKFFVGKLDKNMHGTEGPGEPWNKEPVLGPKFVIVRLGYAPVFTGWRLIYYFPSGAWWHFDVSTYREK
jgi:hypothetical protein